MTEPKTEKDALLPCPFERGQVWENPDGEIMMVLNIRREKGGYKVHYISEEGALGSFWNNDEAIIKNIFLVTRAQPEQAPASDIPGLREAIAEKVLYEDALQYLYDFTGSKPIESTEYQIHMYIYSIFQSAEKGEFND